MHFSAPDNQAHAFEKAFWVRLPQRYYCRACRPQPSPLFRAISKTIPSPRAARSDKRVRRTKPAIARSREERSAHRLRLRRIDQTYTQRSDHRERIVPRPHQRAIAEKERAYDRLQAADTKDPF